MSNLTTPVRTLPRSGYSLANATRWRHHFDAAIETQKNIKIELLPPTNPDCLALSTLKNRITDALKWLAENDISAFESIAGHTQEEYKDLKERIRIESILDVGVQITWRHSLSIRKTNAHSHTIVNRIDSSEVETLGQLWKEELIKFMEDSSDAMFFKGDLTLTESEQDFVREICAGMEYKVSGNEITVVKQ